MTTPTPGTPATSDTVRDMEKALDRAIARAALSAHKAAPHIEDVLAEAACRAEKCLTEWKASPDMIEDVCANVMFLPSPPAGEKNE